MKDKANLESEVKVEIERGNLLVFTKEGKIEEIEKSRFDKNLHVKIEKRPKRNCKKCHGRGYVGKGKKTGQYVVCRCMF